MNNHMYLLLLTYLVYSKLEKYQTTIEQILSKNLQFEENCSKTTG